MEIVNMGSVFVTMIGVEKLVMLEYIKTTLAAISEGIHATTHT